MGAIAFALLSMVGRIPVLGIFVFVFAPYVAGGVIGDHVERWPGSVAFAAIGAVILWWFGASAPPSDQGWEYVGVAFVSLLISVTTARYRWRLRPMSLRENPSR